MWSKQNGHKKIIISKNLIQCKPIRRKDIEEKISNGELKYS